MCSEGVDADTIVSIRAGSTRRQAHASTSQAFAFPSLPLNARPFKVELLRSIGTSEVTVKPNCEVYDLGFQGEANRSMKLRVKEADRAMGGGGKTEDTQAVPCEISRSEKEERKAVAAAEGRSYLEKFNILHFVQEMLQHIIREKPEDPFGSMARYLQKSALANDSDHISNDFSRQCSDGSGDAPIRTEESAIEKDLRNDKTEETGFRNYCDGMPPSVARTETRGALTYDPVDDLKESAFNILTTAGKDGRLKDILARVRQCGPDADELAAAAARARLDAENARLNDDIEKLQRLCKECGDLFTLQEASLSDALAALGPTSAAILEGTRKLQERGDASDESIRKAKLLCNGLADLASRLSDSSRPATSHSQAAAAHTSTARLEAENRELKRQLLALEQSSTVKAF